MFLYREGLNEWFLRSRMMTIPTSRCCTEHCSVKNHGFLTLRTGLHWALFYPQFSTLDLSHRNMGNWSKVGPQMLGCHQWTHWDNHPQPKIRRDWTINYADTVWSIEPFENGNHTKIPTLDNLYILHFRGGTAKEQQSKQTIWFFGDELWDAKRSLSSRVFEHLNIEEMLKTTENNNIQKYIKKFHKITRLRLSGLNQNHISQDTGFDKAIKTWRGDDQ